MVGNVGSVKASPKPDSDTLTKALSLLDTFGDKKGLQSLLAEMKEVQAYNEALEKRVTQALRDAEVQQAQADKDTQNVERNRVAHQHRVAEFKKKREQEEAAFKKRAEAHEEQFKAQQKKLADWQEDLKARAERLEASEKRCAEWQNELHKREETVKGIEQAAEAKRAAVASAVLKIKEVASKVI